MIIECKIVDLESGWSKFCISNEQSTCEIEFSYLENPIEELIYIIYELSIYGIEKEYRVVFPEEPGQYTLYLNCVNVDNLIIKVTSSPEWGKISTAYYRDNEENLIYLDKSETRQNFTKIVFIALKEYINKSSAFHKNEYIKILNRIELNH